MTAPADQRGDGSPRVIQSLEEAEQARKDFLQLKEKAEFILTQLQVRTEDT